MLTWLLKDIFFYIIFLKYSAPKKRIQYDFLSTTFEMIKGKCACVTLFSWQFHPK